jgi:hypothetical protein
MTRNILSEENEEQPIAVEAVQDRILADTRIEICSYYGVEDLTETKTIPADASYLGMTREALAHQLEQMASDLDGEYFQAGLLSASVKSFGTDIVKIRLEYYAKDMGGMYVMTQEDDFVNVMRLSDREIYAHTAIRLSGLPDEVQTRILGGKYYLDIVSVYDFLETYSS